MKDKVLIIGAISNYSVKQFYGAAIKLNKTPIYLFHKEHIPDSPLLKEENYIVTDGLGVECLDAIMENIYTLKNRIFSVVPGGELAVPLTEKVCASLGLSFNQGDINRFRNKKVMRDWLSRGIISQPKQYGIVSTKENIQSLLGGLKFPLIIKPVDGAASFFVKKIEHESELSDAVDAIISHKLSKATGIRFEGTALLEQYIEGTEYSAEVMVHKGVCIDFYITRKLLSDEPYFDEIGHISLSPEYYPNGCEKLVNEVIGAMQVTSAVLHVEFRQNENGKLYLIEVASRIAGDLISNLVELKHGRSLEEFYLLSRSEDAGNLHETQSARQDPDCFVGVRFLFGEDVVVPEKITNLQEDIAQRYIKISENSPKNVVNRTGYILFKSATYEDAISFIRGAQ
ncbi:ATP-grasp domain-containing protein [Rahnella aceris]|uniref:Acetyl-CoA carboxylase biotin carboxylase subunit family protein n=1 Tax=Rahnella sp. (strain Y9602) TaxID=2703885 RepID=A0ABW6CM43_RAHSY